MGTIHRLMEAKKAERQEQGKDAGFSLIELIVVVVIIGILVAIAIPVFGNIQAGARKAAAQAAATDAAIAYSAAIAAPGGTAALGLTAAQANAKGNIGITDESGATTLVEKVCIKALDSTDAAAVWWAGQGALANGTGCKP